MTATQTIDSMGLQALFAQEALCKKGCRADGSHHARMVGYDLLDYIVEGPFANEQYDERWIKYLDAAAKELRESDAASKRILEAFLEVLRTFHDDLSREQRQRIADLGFVL